MKYLMYLQPLRVLPHTPGTPGSTKPGEDAPVTPAPCSPAPCSPAPCSPAPCSLVSLFPCSLFPCLLVSLFPCLLVPLSPCSLVSLEKGLIGGPVSVMASRRPEPRPLPNTPTKHRLTPLMWSSDRKCCWRPPQRDALIGQGCVYHGGHGQILIRHHRHHKCVCGHVWATIVHSVSTQ